MAAEADRVAHQVGPLVGAHVGPEVGLPEGPEIGSLVGTTASSVHCSGCSCTEVGRR